MSTIIIVKDLTPSQEALLGNLLAALQPHQATASVGVPAPLADLKPPVTITKTEVEPIPDPKPLSTAVPPVETKAVEVPPSAQNPLTVPAKTKADIQAALQSFLRRKGPDGTKLATAIFDSVGAKNVSGIPADKYAAVIAALEA